jgi:hypothetical protein
MGALVKALHQRHRDEPQQQLFGPGATRALGPNSDFQANGFHQIL